jgi:hypothetical protein
VEHPLDDSGGESTGYTLPSRRWDDVQVGAQPRALSAAAREREADQLACPILGDDRDPSMPRGSQRRLSVV